MENKELIIKLYFIDRLTATSIAKELNVSNAYITKIIKLDSRYYKEKERRKLENRENHKEKTKRYMELKRKQKGYDVEYALLRQAHEQASRELSGGSKPISNRAFRDWNTSIYKYNEKSKSYVLRKGIIVGADVPKRISWKNF